MDAFQGMKRHKLPVWTLAVQWEIQPPLNLRPVGPALSQKNLTEFASRREEQRVPDLDLCDLNPKHVEPSCYDVCFGRIPEHYPSKSHGGNMVSRCCSNCTREGPLCQNARGW